MAYIVMAQIIMVYIVMSAADLIFFCLVKFLGAMAALDCCEMLKHKNHYSALGATLLWKLRRPGQQRSLLCRLLGMLFIEPDSEQMLKA